MTPTTPTTPQDIAAATGGRVFGRADVRVTGVSTDTRTLRPGDVFVAIVGDRFDGHDLVREAVRRGAAVVVVTRPTAADVVQVVVPETRRALGDLARRHRDTLGGRVVAVGGSNGKTGTKLLINGVLRAGGLTGTAGPASFNNDVGVPLTLFTATQDDAYTIVECGTNHPGEIDRLRDICRPDVCIITSIGHEHLEGLGDLVGVRRENLALASTNSTNIFNGDDQAFLMLADAAGVGYEAVRLTGDVEVTAAGTRFVADGRTWRVAQVGRHAAANALLAIRVGRLFGLGDDVIADGLASADVPPMRMNVRKSGGVVTLDDTYNANPDSVLAALGVLKAWDVPPGGRRIAVIGDMLELGEAAADWHTRVLKRASEVADVVVAVGPLATAAGGDVRCGDASSAAGKIAELTRPGDVVLFKASRGVGLDRAIRVAA